LAAPDTPGATTPPPTERARSPMEVLSEIVFGLALSVGALALVGNPPTSSETLYTSLATFGFSFLVLILVWLSYSRLRSAGTFEGGWSLRLNVILLFTVSIEPFLFDLLVKSNQSAAFQAAVSQAYGIDLGVMIGVLGLFDLYFLAAPRVVLTPEVRRRLHLDGIYRSVVAGIYFVSAAPIFWQVHIDTQPVRVFVWAAGLLVLLAVRFRPYHP
jgi:uncharacterized membrane protein